MKLHRAIQDAIKELPAEQLQEVLDFARFVAHRPEEAEWRKLGRQNLARAYGPDEPDYTEADIITHAKTPRTPATSCLFP